MTYIDSDCHDFLGIRPANACTSRSTLIAHPDHTKMSGVALTRTKALSKLGKRSFVGLLAAVFLAASSTAASAATPTWAPTPDCGDSIQVSVTKHDWKSQTVYFRVLGVDLRRWLGNGYGVMDVYVKDATGTDHAGTYNASGQSGARSAELAAPYPADGHNSPKVTAIIATPDFAYTYCRVDNKEVT